jgi:hypothetical protein
MPCLLLYDLLGMLVLDLALVLVIPSPSELNDTPSEYVCTKRHVLDRSDNFVRSPPSNWVRVPLEVLSSKHRQLCCDLGVSTFPPSIWYWLLGVQQFDQNYPTALCGKRSFDR